MSAPPDDDEPVPRLPRGRGMKLDGAMIMRIVVTTLLLVMVIVSARPCANATSEFVTGFEEKKGSASDTMPKPGNVDQLPKTDETAYERLRPGMTDAEMKAAIDRAKAKAGSASGGTGSASGSAGSASGSAAGSTSGSGSATTK